MERESLLLLVDKNIIAAITSVQAWHYHIFPREVHSGSISLFGTPASISAKGELEVILSKEVSIQLLAEDEMERLLNLYYKREKNDSRINSLNYNGSQDDFLQNLITEAKRLKSSDIHIEIYEERCRIRIRIDGQLVERYTVERQHYASIINKIKIMSSLDISEKRLPQDGRIFFSEAGSKFDIRVSILPILHGEKVVLRLLNNDATEIDLYKLGFSDRDLANYLEGVKKPNGLFLISGPTGSGKTTTLYATLKLLNKDSRNITTIEDPIEYTLEGINQVQLKESIGFTFPAALRNFLRQDPNVIMVGEIRDPETANMAIRASLTGHLVLSTIHTNSAWGTVARLIDMGIPPFLVADTLNTSVAQRLVRVLCPHCKRSEPFSKAMLPSKFIPWKKLNNHFVAAGCPECFMTGYLGRKAVYEVIPIDLDLANAIKAASYQITSILAERGIRTLSENAFGLLESGETSLDEVFPLLINY